MLVIVITSCKKDCATNSEECFDGFVVYGGDPAVDGAGWYLSSSSKAYFVEKIPSGFMIDSLPIHTCLKETNKVKTTMGNVNLHYYEILNISKR